MPPFQIADLQFVRRNSLFATQSRLLVSSNMAEMVIAYRPINVSNVKYMAHSHFIT